MRAGLPCSPHAGNSRAVEVIYLVAITQGTSFRDARAPVATCRNVPFCHAIFGAGPGLKIGAVLLSWCPMPLARIDLIEGKPVEYRRAIGEVVYQAMLTTLNVPKDDRFQVIAEHAASDFVFDPGYLGISRTADCVFIQVTLNAGRTVEMKRAFYKAIADGLHERLKLRREDVLINLVEVGKENWSFGNGEAQYAMPG
jgi:phenylpyruvate tautomerase PptA (4-oxalocrotonate tautomerase family)